MKEILTEIKNIKSGKKELRQFGFLFAGIFIAVAAYSYFHNKCFLGWLFTSGVILLSALVYPKALLPFHKVWMTLAVLLGFVSTRIILAVLFFAIITPLKVFMKSDILDEKIERGKKSYWQKRDKKEYEKIDTERQF